MPTSPYDPNRSHPVFPLFCPCPECPYYQDPENVITKAGTYPVQGGTERRQRLYCQAGQHRFTESAYSPLFRHHGSLKESVQVAKLTTYRLSPEEIADVLERDPRTIRSWQTSLLTKEPQLSFSALHLDRINPARAATGRVVVLLSS